MRKHVIALVVVASENSGAPGG